MNISRLKYFVEVTKAGTFSEASENLYTTQSAVSKQIMALEKELNVPLFDRSKRKVVLTEQGEIVLNHAQILLDDYDSLINDLANYTHYPGGKLAIASIPVMAQYDITGMVANFRQSFPNVNMVIDEHEACDILSALSHREYDLAFMRSDLLDSTYETSHICKDHLIAILPLQHPLANNTEITLSELKDETIILLNKGTLTSNYTIDACKKLGFSPLISFSGTRMENIIDLVAHNMGVSLLMKQAVSYMPRSTVAFVPLKEEITSYISLVKLRRKKLTVTAQVFWDYVSNLYK